MGELQRLLRGPAMPERLGITTPAYALFEAGAFDPVKYSHCSSQTIRDWFRNLPKAIGASSNILAAHAKGFDRILSIPEMLADLTEEYQAKLPAMIEARTFLSGSRDLKPETVEIFARALLQCELQAAYSAKVGVLS